jgi:hypothetical protein
MDREIPNGVLRIGAIASVVAGVLLIVGFALHPAGEDATHGTDPLWVPAHGLLWLAFTLALPGWIAVYAAQGTEAGRLGITAFVVIILGTSLACWIFSSDVTFVPVIAAESPELFGKIFSASHIAIGIASVLTWVTGNVLIGLSIVRARVFPRWTGVLLAVGTLVIPIAYLAGFSVRVAAMGATLAGAVQIWLGYDVLRKLQRRGTAA